MSDDSGDEYAGLFRRDDPEAAELAIVFGHSEPRVAAARAKHAARLFLRGLAPTLLLSGGRTTAAESEAELMARACVGWGVPRERLLLEERSRTTFENAERSLELLAAQRLLDGLRTVLLVSCPWHMRRVLLTMRGAFPAHVRFLCCPHDRGCTAATWRESAECSARVTTERELLRRFLDAGLLRE
jgi:uncharacterized SAM-binding protein YcdF (DUF218 family)